MILPINEKPSVTTCIHYAYPCAIIESPLLSRIVTKNIVEHQWNEISENVRKAVHGEVIEFYEQGNSSNKYNFCMWKECEGNETVELLIEHFKELNLFRYVDVLVFYGDEEHELEIENKQCSVRWNQYGYFTGKEMHCFDTKIYTSIRTTIKDDYVTFWASQNGENWEIVKSIYLSKRDNERRKILFQFYWGEDTYTAWKSMNFIQLLYNRDNPYRGISLDYYFFTRKNHDNGYGHYSNYIDTNYDVIYDYLDCFKSVRDFFVWCIKHNYYVSVCIDEYYLPGRRCYKKYHYQHYNLIYGYDDDKEIYYIMGFEDDIVLSEVSCEIINMENIKSEKIIRYKYKLNENTNFTFNKERLIDILREFVASVPMGRSVENIMTSENLEYGIDVLKVFWRDEKEQEKLFKDKRISFLIWEHSVLMKERIEYVYSLGYLTQNEYVFLKEAAEGVVQKANSLLVSILKCIVSGNKNDKPLKLLQDIYDAEKKLCQNLIQYLL